MSQTFERPVSTFLDQKVEVSKHQLNIELPGLNGSFEACPYSKKIQGENQILYDTTVRNCQKAQINGSQFAPINSTLSSIITLANEVLSENNGNTWTVLKYSRGHFTEHIDFERPIEGYVHIANQILLPPKSKCRYQGGCLKTWDGIRRFEIYPDEFLWTRVIIPHGTPHLVENVIGTRISYMSPVYLVKKEGHLYENKNQDQQLPGEA